MTMTNAEINETIARALYPECTIFTDMPKGAVTAWTPEGNRIHSIDYTTDANACFDACEKLGYYIDTFPLHKADGSVEYTVQLMHKAKNRDRKDCLMFVRDLEYEGPQITPLLARAIAEAVRKGEKDG